MNRNGKYQKRNKIQVKLQKFKIIAEQIDTRVERPVWWRKMKTKKQINSIYKRKKRKVEDDEMARQDSEEKDLISTILPYKSKTSLSGIDGRRRDNQSMLLLTTTNLASAKSSSRRNVLLLWLTFVTAINIAQLICDTSNKWSVFGADLQGKSHKASSLSFSYASFSVINSNLILLPLCLKSFILTQLRCNWSHI